MAGPFKMMGSPMQRNFGISPAKNKEGTKTSEKLYPYVEMIKKAHKVELKENVKEKKRIKELSKVKFPHQK